MFLTSSGTRTDWLIMPRVVRRDSIAFVYYAVERGQWGHLLYGHSLECKPLKT